MKKKLYTQQTSVFIFKQLKQQVQQLYSVWSGALPPCKHVWNVTLLKSLWSQWHLTEPQSITVVYASYISCRFLYACLLVSRSKVTASLQVSILSIFTFRQIRQTTVDHLESTLKDVYFVEVYGQTGWRDSSQASVPETLPTYMFFGNPVNPSNALPFHGNQGLDQSRAYFPWQPRFHSIMALFISLYMLQSLSTVEKVDFNPGIWLPELVCIQLLELNA